MTVQNKMAVLMMSGGLGELQATDKNATSKTQKTDNFNEVFKTADRSYAETDRVENAKSVQKTDAVSAATTDEVQTEAKQVKTDEREQALKSVFGKVISEGKDALSKDELVVTDEVMAMLQNLLQNISEQLQEILGVSEEQLDLAASELGMTEMDLLNPNSVTELVVQLKANGDFTELISNEELHKEVTSLLNMIETEMADMAKELGLTNEQFEQLVDEALAEENVADDIIRVNENQEDVVDFEQQNPETSQTITVDKSGGKEMSQEDASQDAMSQNDNAMFREVITNLEQNVVAATDEPQAAQIVRQVIEQIQIRAREDMTSMEIQLTPENLGKVNLQVVAKDGAVTAQITTETLAAKEAIEAQINVLRENLNEQGVKVEAVEVTVESHKFESNSEQNRENAQQNESGTRRRFIDLNNVEEGQFEDTAAVLAREIMMSNGNRMDIIT